MPIHELLERILGIVRGAWRFRWLSALVAWAICLVGWSAIWMMPDTYESRARLFVDTESVLRPLLQGLAVNSDVMSQVNMVRAVIMSRPNLERVAKDTGLADRAKSRAAYDAMIADLPRAIGLTPTSRESTFEITFRDTDPAMAQRVVNSMLQSFVSGSSSLKVADTETAQQFLESQIKEYEGRLRAAESRLAEFKQRNVGLMPAQNSDYYGRLQAELDRLQALQAKLRQASERRAELRAQLDGEQPSFGLVPSNSETGALDAQIADLKRRLDSLLVQYTEKHPDVLVVRQQIEQLEQRKESARGQRQQTRSPQQVSDPQQIAMRALDVNPVYQSMKISLSQTEVEIADLRAQLDAQQAIVGQLRGRVDTMPKVEADLAQLNRDYEVNRAQYTALLQRLESARLSNDAQQSSGQVKVRTLDEPLVPRSPVSPPRTLLITAILILGLLAGAALAVVLNLLKPVFSGKVDVQGTLGLPVIGSVQEFRPPQVGGVLAGDRFRIVFVIAMMVVAYALVLVLSVFKPFAGLTH